MIKKDIYNNLRNIPKDKKIAIWGLSSKSFEILVQTVNYRIRVDYFVDADGDYDGAPIFDKEIITKQELEKRRDIFSIICKEHYLKEESWIQHNLKENFCVSQLGAISSEIKNCDRVYIYGAGGCGKKTLQIFKEQNIEIQGFIDSDKNKWGKSWCNYFIYGKDVLQENDIVVISSLAFSEIYRDLKQDFCEDNIFIDFRNAGAGKNPIGYKDMNNVWIQTPTGRLNRLDYSFHSFISAIWNDLLGKKIIFYGNNEITKQAIEIFSLFGGIEIAYIVENEENIGVAGNKDYEVKDVYDLAYENMDDKMIIITKYDEEKVRKTGTLYLDSGIKLTELDMGYFKNFRNITLLSESGRFRVKDKTMGTIAVYEKTKLNYPGLYFFEKKNYRKRIVVLGGSTSTAALYENVVKGWPEYLSYKYEDVEIISAAEPAIMATEECLKLLRDVGQLKADLVISYNGVNEVSQDRVENHPFYRGKKEPDISYGIENNMDKVDFWILIEKYMKAICEVNGSDFISILQPALPLKQEEDLSCLEKRVKVLFDNENMLMRDYTDFVIEAKEKIKDYQWMYDLSDVFCGVKETIYRDNCHLSDRGNQIIADNIYNIILDYYKKRGEEF